MIARILLSPIAVFGLAALAHAQVPNGGFENWTDFGTYDDPDDWITLNASTSALGAVGCTQGSPGDPGAHYVQLTTINLTGIGTLAGTIISGSLLGGNVGFPYATRPASLDGNWQYVPTGTDAGSIIVSLSKWNAGTQTRDGVAVGALNSSGTIGSWTAFSVPLFYSLPDIPDTATIEMISSSGTPVAGSYLRVDDLHFSGTAAGINTLDAGSASLELFPSPAEDVLNVTIGDATIDELSIWSMDGRVVRELRPLATGNATIELAGLASGSYVVHAQLVNGSRLSKPFVKR